MSWRRFVCKSLTKLIRELKERTFTLEWVKNKISRSRNGACFDDNEWVPLTFTVRQFLDNIRHALVQFPIVWNENQFSIEMSSAILDLFIMFGIWPKEWDQRSGAWPKKKFGILKISLDAKGHDQKRYIFQT